MYICSVHKVVHPYDVEIEKGMNKESAVIHWPQSDTPEMYCPFGIGKGRIVLPLS